MCYRIASTKDIEVILKVFSFAKPTGLFLNGYKPSENFRPLNLVPVVTLSEGQYIITMMRWGLLPHWIKDDAAAKKLGYGTANARSETLHEKPSFKNYLNNRCIMIADAFYEPVRFIPIKNKMLIIAAIYSNWKEQLTCTMITTTANDVVQPFKDRMPVLLEDDDKMRWLNNQPYHDVKELLKPCNNNLITLSGTTNN